MRFLRENRKVKTTLMDIINAIQEGENTVTM